jgi:hypothetical protein
MAAERSPQNNREGGAKRYREMKMLAKKLTERGPRGLWSLVQERSGRLRRRTHRGFQAGCCAGSAPYRFGPAVQHCHRNSWALSPRQEIEPTAATLPGFELMPAFGWVGPANMPPDIVKKLIEEFVAVGKIPEVRTALEKFGVLQTEQPGPAYAEALAKERAGYARVIERAGIKVP